ncbi:MAG TPA: SCP2 sterol-binding domain-containing protein [Mycobacteriales bacterium]|nr:SCP2 sterol-binding domain-containing protein [Mycobacteriales bacterium]
MATVRQCRRAVDRLVATIDGLNDEDKSRHLPRRTVICIVSDLGVWFTARVDETGVHDVALHSEISTLPSIADVRVTLDSEDLVALAEGREDILSAWLRGRVHVSAPMRDMLRLRALLGVL